MTVNPKLWLFIYQCGLGDIGTNFGTEFNVTHIFSIDVIISDDLFLKGLQDILELYWEFGIYITILPEKRYIVVKQNMKVQTLSRSNW